MRICVPVWVQGCWRQLLAETEPAGEGLILEGFPLGRQRAIRDRVLAGLDEKERRLLGKSGVRLAVAPPSQAGSLAQLDDLLVELVSAVAYSPVSTVSSH